MLAQAPIGYLSVLSPREVENEVMMLAKEPHLWGIYVYNGEAGGYTEPGTKQGDSG